MKLRYTSLIWLLVLIGHLYCLSVCTWFGVWLWEHIRKIHTCVQKILECMLDIWITCKSHYPSEDWSSYYGYDHLVSMRIFTLIMNNMLTSAPQSIKKGLWPWFGFANHVVVGNLVSYPRGSVIKFGACMNILFISGVKILVFIKG